MVDDTDEGAIVLDRTLGDNDHAFAEGGDILHVVAGEKDGDLAFLLVVLEKLLDIVLRHHIEPDGRFIEEEDFGSVEEGGDEFHLHAFAEGEFANGSSEEFLDFEEAGEFVEMLLEGIGRDAIDLLVESKGFLGGEIPPELVLLPHDEGKASAVFVIAFPGDIAHDGSGSGGGIDDAT